MNTTLGLFFKAFFQRAYFLRIENHFKESGWAQTDNEAFFLHRQFLLTQLSNFENAKTPFSDDIQVLRGVFLYRCIRIVVYNLFTHAIVVLNSGARMLSDGRSDCRLG